MSKATKSKKSENTAMNPAELIPGKELEFIGYTDLEEGVDPLLEAGDRVVVKHTSKEKDGTVTVEVHLKDDRTTTETLLLDEVRAAPEEDEEETEKPQKETAVKKKTTQAAAKPAAKTKAPAKAKGTAVATVPQKPAATKEEASMETLVHLPSLRKILKTASTPKELSNTARDLVAEAEKTYFTLGGVLAEIYQTGGYQKLGYRLEDFNGKADKAFGAFVETELGFKGRKGLYLVNIYRNFSKLDVDEARLAKIGWTKIRLIANHVTADNLSALLKDAEKMTRDELEDYVKTELVKVKSGAAEKGKRVTYKFSVFGDQAENVDAAIKRAQEATTSDKPSDNLQYIVLDWMENIGGQEVANKEAAIALVEAKYGIQLQEVKQDAPAEIGTMTDETVNKVAKKKGVPKAKAKTKAAAKPKAKAKAKSKRAA